MASTSEITSTDGDDVVLDDVVLDHRDGDDGDDESNCMLATSLLSATNASRVRISVSRTSCRERAPSASTNNGLLSYVCNKTD